LSLSLSFFVFVSSRVFKNSSQEIGLKKRKSSLCGVSS
jgi:hypothetical protein